MAPYSPWPGRHFRRPGNPLDTDSLYGTSFKNKTWFRDVKDGPGDLGNEIDAPVTAKLHGYATFQIKYADYSGKGFAASRRKIWLAFDFKI